MEAPTGATVTPSPAAASPGAEAVGPASGPPTSVAAGWYGKLPSLGDFASRRLPDSFIRSWDRWLQAGMQDGSSRHGSGWLDLYLTFPVWRFLLPSDGPADDPWCGVLLPSVDRVGRCFPLTIARSCPAPWLAAGLDAIEQRLAPLADAGLAALEGQSVEAFDARLVATEVTAECDAAATPLGAVTARLLRSGLAGRSLWWMFDNGATTPSVRLESATLMPGLFTSLVAQ